MSSRSVVVKKTTSTVTTSPILDETLMPSREILTPIPEQDIATLMDVNNSPFKGFNGSSKDDVMIERSYSYEETMREVDSPIHAKRWGLSAAALSFLDQPPSRNMLTNGNSNGYTTSLVQRETERKRDKNTKSLVVTTKTHRIEKKDPEEDESEGWRKFLHEVKALSDSDDPRGFDLVSAESKTTEIEEGTRPKSATDSVSWKKMSTRTYEYKNIA
jgi:hypothetical protein